MRTLLTLLGVLAVAVLNNGHVSLTFPRANAPAYDFLDNVRTGSPCGIPLNQSLPRTKLVATESYNFTFHLAYPHRGAFCINLLNSTGHVLYQLTDGFVEANLSTSRQYTVKLPDLPCNDCYVQLIRQALEWVGPGSYGSVYLFWSCANVNVLAKSSPKDCGGTDCNGHGTCTAAGKCQCTGMWYGDYCQYQDGCRADADCNGHGRCVDLRSTSQPQHECFCDAGWQGPTCTKTSSLTAATFDPKDYNGYLRALPNLEYWYKYIPGSTPVVEVAIKYNGTGEWVGFGFRPADLTSTCWTTAPGFNPAKTDNGTVTPWKGAESKSESWGVPWAGGAEEEEEEEEEEGGGLHAMDCTDIVIARVDGNQHRILDYYTRDRSTPQLDEWYGGTQNIIAAVGAHVDGVTWIRYQKPTRISPKNKFDHEILNTTMDIIWAHGQVMGKYLPTVPPPPSPNPDFVADFYRPLELKYHGTNNRGRHSDNLINPVKVIPATCSYTHPCTGGSGCYQAKWGQHPTKNNIVFELTIGGTSSNWIGIGFSDDNKMANSDIVTGIVDGSSQLMVVDRWASAQAKPPADNDQSQIVSASGSASDTTLTIQFQRTIATTDSSDLSLDVARFLLFAWGDVASNDISYHRANRAFTNNAIDMTKCTFNSEITSDPAPTTPIPTTPIPTTPVCTATVPCSSSNCLTMTIGVHPEDSGKYVVDLSVAGDNTNWLAIGFSNDTFMPDTDIFLGMAGSDGSADVTKRTATARRLPAVDSDQSSVISAGSSTSGGKIRVQFQTNLPQSIVQTGGRYILLAYGKISGNAIAQHSSTDRFVSPAKSDVRNCPAYQGDIISGARTNVASLFLLLAASLSTWFVC